MMRTTDRLIAPSRGTAGEAIAWAQRAGAQRMDEVATFIREVYRIASLAGLDAAILVAHSAVETGNWQSVAWRERLNPSGLGVTDGGDLGYAFASGVDAARAHVVHHALYALGDIAAGPLAAYASLDPRSGAIPAAWRGSVRTIADLTEKWWTNPQGAEAVAARGNVMFPQIPDQEETMVKSIVFGRVPKPPWVDQYIEKPAGHGYGDYGFRRLRGIVLHRMVGTLQGTRSHFRATNGHGLDALTDWGIGGALDGALDGTIDRYNDPDGRRSPWASGPATDGQGGLLVNGDAIAWYERYALTDPAGVNIFNRDTEAIELSGYYDTPISDRQYQALITLIAWRLDHKMKLPWHVWPKNHDGLQAVLWHGEIMGWQKPCPGRVVIDLTDRLINDVRDYLRRYQEHVGLPESPAPAPHRRPEDDPEVLKSWFGRLHVAGRTLTYSPKAAENPASVSAIWRAHGEATGLYPRIAAFSELADGTRIFEFDGGWRIIDPSGPARARATGRTGGSDA